MKLNKKPKNSLISYLIAHGASIPHYCYHKNLSISGNCRMCLVELKNSPKPIVSCAMSAKACLNNGEIYTNSPLVKKARENILEFLLLNHPLDCPICDQGGECDLQDQSLFFGLSKKRFYNYKRIVTDKNIGPIVKTVMTRCIHCTRCVRFATEIAGVEDLGIFGRGVNSEIGTYITKIFQSELSGNVIDLCPVGALTSKPYPFLGRNWELKTTNTIDFSDGFGVNLQAYIKNNKIIKLLPGYDTNLNGNNWISDKTRFSFDGMFSPERALNGFLINGKNKTENFINWDILFEELIYTLYFRDHLTHHFSKIHFLIILFTNTLNIESLTLLKILSKKYNFFKARTSDSVYINNDLETNFITTTINKSYNLLLSNFCMLLGINTRYEGAQLNLKLRQRYLKGNFKIFSLNSILDLTFSTKYLGTNIKILKSISEGNNFFCQNLKNSTNPFLIYNSQFLKRKDSKTFLEFLKILKLYTNLKKKNWNGVNILNSSINSVGLNYLKNFKSLSTNDLQNFIGIYTLNTNYNISNIKKLIELKILNYSITEKKNSKIFIEQNSGIKTQFFENIQENYNIYKYINLPNKVFFESTGTFMNTEGFLKKSISFLTTNNQLKEDWQILRKLYNYSKNINFLTNLRLNNIIAYNSNNILNFRNFIKFQYYTTKNLNNSVFFFNYEKKIYNYNKIFDIYKQNKTKLFQTKIRLWLDDFYIGGNDIYTKYSSTMITCSKLYRLNTKNFNYSLNLKFT